jgi:hypothetical protein
MSNTQEQMTRKRIREHPGPSHGWRSQIQNRTKMTASLGQTPRFLLRQPQGHAVKSATTRCWKPPLLLAHRMWMIWRSNLALLTPIDTALDWTRSYGPVFVARGCDVLQPLFSRNPVRSISYSLVAKTFWSLLGTGQYVPMVAKRQSSRFP